MKVGGSRIEGGSDKSWSTSLGFEHTHRSAFRSADSVCPSSIQYFLPFSDDGCSPGATVALFEHTQRFVFIPLLE